MKDIYILIDACMMQQLSGNGAVVLDLVVGTELNKSKTNRPLLTSNLTLSKFYENWGNCTLMFLFEFSQKNTSILCIYHVRPKRRSQI